MIRKITLICLLFFGLSSKVDAQVLDSVSIFLPIGMDTTCPGSQLIFYAVQSNDTFSTARYHWYTNHTFTGVVLDTFYTTGVADGDTVFCNLVYRNSLGLLDSFTHSNFIIVHRADTIVPRVIISLTTGNNPDCSGGPLTFTAYPINGGTAPAFQWLVNGLPLPAEDSQMITAYFSAGDSVACRMIGNSTCSDPYSDTATSASVVISHDSLTATISISALYNPICLGTRDSFWAVISDAGAGFTFSWYVNSTLVPTALGPTFVTTSLHNGDLVYCVLHAPDHCVINHTTVSNVINMTVVTPLVTSAYTIMTGGANPGCLDSPVTFTGTYVNFGIAPDYDWYVNGVLVSHNTSTFTYLYLDGDLVFFRVKETDNGCYAHDSITTPAVLMLRDSTPVTPWLSLNGDLLVSNGGGHYLWYFNTVNSCVGATLIPGVDSSVYNPHVNGYYFIVKDTANCQSLCSNVLYISLLGVKNVNLTDVKMYPNPTTGILYMEWNNLVNMKVDVYNIIGQGLLHEEINNQSSHETNLSYLPEGNYFIVLRDEDGSKATYKVYLSK